MPTRRCVLLSEFPDWGRGATAATKKGMERMPRRATWMAAMLGSSASLSWPGRRTGRVEISGTRGLDVQRRGERRREDRTRGGDLQSHRPARHSFSWSARIGFLASEHLESRRPLRHADERASSSAATCQGDARRREDLPLPRLLRVQLRRRARPGAALRAGRAGGDAVRLRVGQRRRAAGRRPRRPSRSSRRRGRSA